MGLGILLGMGGWMDYVGTNLFTLYSCGSCGLPVDKTCLCRVPSSLDSSPPQTMVKIPYRLVLLLLLPVKWFCMNTTKIAKNKLFL